MIGQAERVKEANKCFYNKIGDKYEQSDGRRSEGLAGYVRAEIGSNKRGSLLDLGCGSGFVCRNALGLYERVYGLDISHKILHDIDSEGILRINGDLDHLPFRAESFDCVVTFATLHHCYGFEGLFKEIYRVLKRGGLYYSDHDMNDQFYTRYKTLLRLYRSVFNPLRRYRRQCPSLQEMEYHLSEYHSKGIPTHEIRSLLEAVGFSKVSMTFHWYGLNPLTDMFWGKREMGPPSAPLVKIRAIK